MTTVLIVLVALALVFDFLNGFHDSSNIVATIIFSRAMAPRRALLLTAAAEFCGPFLFGVAVANTIGSELVSPAAMTIQVVLAALISAILWNLVTWFFGIPSSSSHALVGGILGSVTVGLGIQAILWGGLAKIMLALFLSPVLGLLAGFLVTRLVFFLARRATPRINWFFCSAQNVTGVALALSHGANDAQKTMGLITLGLLVTKAIPTFSVPLWVIALSAGAISAGTAVGGWRLIRTLGARFYKIKPIHGFSAQIASAAVIFGAAVLGGPVSTTHVVSSAILGAGSAQRVNMVRWGVAGQIATAWLLTIPATALVSAGIYLLLNLVF